jgi:hypothetical protein
VVSISFSDMEEFDESAGPMMLSAIAQQAMLGPPKIPDLVSEVRLAGQ